MKLCECGCGGEVKSSGAKYVLGHHNRSPEVKERKRQVMIAKYGVDNPSKVKEFQDMKIDTSMIKYGTRSPNQSDIVKQKKIDTSRLHFGVDHTMQSDIVKNKSIQTNLKRRGTKWAMQSLEVQEKAKKTYQENWGSDHWMSAEGSVEKLKNIFRDLYGVDNPSQLDEVKRKKIETSIKNCGFPVWAQTIEGRLFCRERAIEHVEFQKLQGMPLYPCSGKKEILCLNELQQNIDYVIIRNIKLFGVFPDGYIEMLKLAIEFDEPHHAWAFQKIVDIKKNEIYRVNGICYFRIFQKDWEKNKEEVIENFVCVIKGLEAIQKLQAP